MISESDTPVHDILALFNKFGLDVSFLVPTRTGFDKGYMDAVKPLRHYLKINNFHDYDTQQQGKSNKVIVEAFFIHENIKEKTECALFRPSSKNGDPRIRISRLKKYAKPYNLIAFHVFRGDLYIINASNEKIIRSIYNPVTPLGRIAYIASHTMSDHAKELLFKINEINKMGPVKSKRLGSTGIGKTLEDLLGIKENSEKTPDYKGIEVKARRNLITSRKSALFTQSPDWALSPIGNAMALLKGYGYCINNTDELHLNCSVSASSVNSQSLMLSIPNKENQLWAIYKNNGKDKHLLTWQFDVLKSRLEEKHRETFWVYADCEKAGKIEYFHYNMVIHTQKPRIGQLEYLIEEGIITLDLMIKQKGNRAKDHGYSFKIDQKHLQALFTEKRSYVLPIYGVI